jgi:hypothetical protein
VFVACSNCGMAIWWMDTMNQWIHADTGLRICEARQRRRYKRHLLPSISGRHEVALPSRWPAHPSGDPPVFEADPLGRHPACCRRSEPHWLLR